MQDVTLWTNKLLGLGIVTLKAGEDEGFDFEDNEGDNDEDDDEEDDEEGFE